MLHQNSQLQILVFSAFGLNNTVSILVTKQHQMGWEYEHVWLVGKDL
jgi:hypothetical protein